MRGKSSRSIKCLESLPESPQQELMTDGDHNFQDHARKELKKRGREVLEGENANSIYKRVQAKEGNNPFQILTAAQIKQRNDSISKSKTKEGGALQVNWNKKLQAFIDFDGIPKKRYGTVGTRE